MPTRRSTIGPSRNRRERVLRRSLIAVLSASFGAAMLGDTTSATQSRVEAGSTASSSHDARTGRAPPQPFAYQYAVRSATWRSSAEVNGTDDSPATVVHGTGTVEGRL